MDDNDFHIPFERVEALAARKLTEQQIADVLDIDLTKLKTDRELLRRFREAIRKGSSKGQADLSNALYNQAKAGNRRTMNTLTTKRKKYKKPPGDSEE